MSTAHLCLTYTSAQLLVVYCGFPFTFEELEVHGGYRNKGL